MTWLSLALLVLSVSTAQAQRVRSFSEEDFEKAFSFFAGGGTWALRLSPSVDADKEAKWKVLVLRARGSTKTSFQLGPAELGPKSSISSAQKLLDLYDADRAVIIEFLRCCADRVEKGELEALLVTTSPLKQGQPVPMQAAVVLTKAGLLDLIQTASSGEKK